jgi:hypothetical protein
VTQTVTEGTMEDPNRNYTTVTATPARSSGTGGILFALGAIVVALGVIFWLMTGDEGPTGPVATEPVATEPVTTEPVTTEPAPAATETAPVETAPATEPAPATGTDTGTDTGTGGTTTPPAPATSP